MTTLTEKDRKVLIKALTVYVEFYKKGSVAYNEKMELLKKLKEMSFVSISDIERSKGRSEGYHSMNARDQWDEDKRLGILDWDGN